jgi:hypothetical protein
LFLGHEGIGRVEPSAAFVAFFTSVADRRYALVAMQKKEGIDYV